MISVYKDFYPFFVNQFLQPNKSTMVVVNNDYDGYKLSKQLRLLRPEDKIFYLPSWDCQPYERFSPDISISAKRIQVLLEVFNKPHCCLILDYQSLIQYLPPASVLVENYFHLKTSQEISQKKLIDIFQAIGFRQTVNVYEVGEYALRGDIVDVFPANAKNPYRLDFFGNTLEKIRYFDAVTQRTLGEKDHCVLHPINEIVMNEESINNFCQNYRQISTNPSKDPIYQAISQQQFYGGCEHYLPLFYNQISSITDFFSDGLQIFIDQAVPDLIVEKITFINSCYQDRLNFRQESHNAPLPSDRLYWGMEKWQNFSAQNNLTILNDRCTSLKAVNFLLDKNDLEKCLKDLLLNYQVIIACATDGIRQHLYEQLSQYCNVVIAENIFNLVPLQNYIYLVTFPIDQGFVNDKQIIFSDQDILGERRSKPTTKKRKTEQFFQEAAQLQANDYIVHQNHGIGQYTGLETIKVENAVHDCLVLIYDGGDKLYLPVENFDLLTRYGSDLVAASLDRLGSLAWQQRKAKVKKRLKSVADYLLKIAAQRAQEVGEVFTTQQIDFEKFCDGFPYAETEDQLKAIDEVITDMASGKPMDRLICGDVGFGKTEVALRAAFLAVANGKQVAIITPTTLLCRQHFYNFAKRFQGFNKNIAQISRLLSPKNVKTIKEKIALGEVDIIVGTHSLLSDSIKFANLGLVIVDEEQHFGVKQKEQLKKLCNNVHILTLTATPIPRTLQMALTGVRDLSLISMAPVDRLAVHTFIVPYDSLTIRDAILREYNRGGQVFAVTPRIEYLNKFYDQLQSLVPDLKIRIVSGQNTANELESTIADFCDHKFDILLATNIIESGIDIPNANTIIIHRADLFGLAQLYQLRGRVGREKKQSYAYLMTPENITETAKKRLEVMHHLDHLGAGFRLASYDLDIRGAGNIMGEEQSGHIKEVGVELYQQLLEETINSIKNQDQSLENNYQPSDDWSPQINLGVSILIPEYYVPDLTLRLNLYKRIASLNLQKEIDDFKIELIDRFGKIPLELENLLKVIRIKYICKKIGILKLDTGPKGITVTLNTQIFMGMDKILLFLQTIPSKKLGTAKLKPDNKIVFFYPTNVNIISPIAYVGALLKELYNITM